MNRNELYKRITDKIIDQLKKGTIPWRKSWRQGLPSNYITKQPYNGINRLSLLLNDYPSPYYLTYLQTKSLGGRIHKDEKGHLIVFWKIVMLKDDQEHIDEFPLLRYTYVFNISQTNLYNPVDQSTEKILSCEQIIENITPTPIIRYNISQCFYDMKNDYISIPVIGAFNTSEDYYASLFHELIHWTAHKSRLDRDKLDYATEELIAELGSSFLCAITGIEQSVIDNQASYIDYWSRQISNDPKILLKASRLAQQACDYLLKSTEWITTQPPNKASLITPKK